MPTVALLDTVGFLADDVKPLGPVQLYVAPDTVGVLNVSVKPAHTGPLLPAVGVEGTAFTIRASAGEVEAVPPQLEVMSTV
jgi:hypothetical protein